MKYCHDYPGPESCCDSCHDDADEGYSDLCYGLDEGDEYLVCCARLRNQDRK